MTNENSERPSFLRVVKSTLAAAFGVQSDKNRLEDFSKTSIFPYIAAGVIFTAIFIVVLVGIVSMVISGMQKTE